MTSEMLTYLETAFSNLRFWFFYFLVDSMDTFLLEKIANKYSLTENIAFIHPQRAYSTHIQNNNS